MGKLLRSVGGWVLSFLLTVWTVVKIILDWIGRSTIPEDWEALMHEKLPSIISWIFSTPWYVPAILATILTIWMMWVSWPTKNGKMPSGTEVPHQEKRVVADNSTPKPPSFEATQILFNSALLPAHNLIGSIVNSYVGAIAKHPNPSVRSLIQIVQSGVRNPIAAANGKLFRAIREIDNVDEETLQKLVAFYWEQYRCQRIFILENHKSVKESGLDLPTMQQFRLWLDADGRFVEALRLYCGPQDRETVRNGLKDSWDEQIRHALLDLLPSPTANPSLQSPLSTAKRKRR